MDDDLFPYRAAKGVLQVVDLIHYHHFGVVEPFWFGIEHVPQYFGGHHHSGCDAVDRVVPGEQANVICPKPTS